MQFITLKISAVTSISLITYVKVLGKKYEIKRHYSTLHERAQGWKQLSRCACTAAELKQHKP